MHSRNPASTHANIGSSSFQLIEDRERLQQDQERLVRDVQSLSLELQKTLVLDELLHIFCDQVRQIVPCDSVAYDNPEAGIFWRSGTERKHKAHYTLTLDQASLGEVHLSREHPFSDHDTQVIEWLVSIAVFPIRNALLYREALHASLKDGLTQIGNRLAFDEAIAREIEKARRADQPLSLVVVDIDHFKQLNDQHGHAVGDMVLKQAASLLKAALRASDEVFRYGGEEFAVLLTNTDTKEARVIAERLRKTVNGYTAKLVAGQQPLQVTISLGVASLGALDDAHRLFDKADVALYEAKKSGRNRVRVAV
jgi:diguanylate cyclase (GGDEF)-like protein